MNRRLFGLCCAPVALLLCVFGVGTARAQRSPLPGCSSLAPYFCVDAGYFLQDDSYVIDVYFLVCNEGLQFVRSGDGYNASADILVVLLDGKDRQIAGDTYRIKLHSERYEETTSVDSCKTRVMSFKAAPGDFGMVVTVYDGDSRRKSVLETSIAIPALDDLPGMSDIAFVSKSGRTGGWRWRGFEPKVKRTYNTADEEIYFYYEVYHSDAGDSVHLRYEIRDDREAVVYTGERTSVGSGTITYLEKIASDTLSNGRYVLSVVMTGPDGAPGAVRSKQFEVRTEVFLFDRDIEQAVSLLTYVASGGFISEFEKADLERRKRLWEQFWREKDPTPGTPKNEFYEEHVRRFNYANENFGQSLSKGWRTDRGRIYILYGDPDEIEAYPMEMGRNPTEVWYYFSRGRRFVFVDETGFGDYVLVREQ